MMSDRQDALRQHLKIHMALNGASLVELSKAVKISRQSLSVWLAGKTMLQDHNVKKIIDYLYYSKEGI